MKPLTGDAKGQVKLMLIIVAGVCLCAAIAFAAVKGLERWRARDWINVPYATQNNTVKIPGTTVAPEQEAHFFSANIAAPLIVDLHPWSSRLGSPAGDNGIRLDELAFRNSWSYIRPTMTGHNRNTDGCCSDMMIESVKAAIDYARKRARVTSVHVIGGSGGGYTALCGALSQKLEGVTSYQAWVPITDLERWYQQRPAAAYQRDILACTGSTSGLNAAEAGRRSPMAMSIPPMLPTIHLLAGVHDGFGGDPAGIVSITHSIRMYNRLSKVPVSDDVILQLLESRKGPQSASGSQIDGRQIHLAAQNGMVSLTIFEGGHELLAKAAMEIAIKDEAASNR
jgi:pimeloyl-ACP methyl ester carboxylesterase